MNFFVLSLLLLCSTPSFAEKLCFLAKENHTLLKQEGDCSTRFTPQSTFKIALSLIGYDTKILQDENHPEWTVPLGVDPSINVCKGSHNPRTWLRDSCVWYSQVLTQKLGMEKFKEYVVRLAYGNQDVSGDPIKQDGLTRSWLSSSLEISPEEQVIFLQKFLNHQLAVSEQAYIFTQEILFREELPGGWKLYGKTGNGPQLNSDKTQQLNLQHGWFVGWIEKDQKVIVFATHINDTEPQDSIASFRAKAETINRLWVLINEKRS